MTAPTFLSSQFMACNQILMFTHDFKSLCAVCTILFARKSAAFNVFTTIFSIYTLDTFIAFHGYYFGVSVPFPLVSRSLSFTLTFSLSLFLSSRSSICLTNIALLLHFCSIEIPISIFSFDTQPKVLSLLLLLDFFCLLQISIVKSSIVKINRQSFLYTFCGCWYFDE